MANYTGFLVPKMALFSNILLMMAILLWRPQGVYAVTSEPAMLTPCFPTTCRAAAAGGAADPGPAVPRRWPHALLFPGTKALNVAAKMLVFIVLVASFDLLLGYTGIVSFAHTMFFGIGAYGVAIACTRLGPAGTRAGAGHAGRAGAVLVLALAIGLFSLRVRAIFFSMITLALASAFQTLASQLSDFTGGEDGLTFKMPEVLSPGTSSKTLPRRLARRPAADLLPAVRRRGGAVPGHAAHRQLAVRPRAAGDPRERVPRRGHRLPRGGLPHGVQRPVGAVRHAGRRACWRSGCATTGRTPRCPSRSCWTSC
jgi:hypothetical protein